MRKKLLNISTLCLLLLCSIGEGGIALEYDTVKANTIILKSENGKEYRLEVKEDGSVVGRLIEE
jgi:hypothetical protein